MGLGAARELCAGTKAHEWVGWIEGEPTVTLRMPEQRALQRVRVGMSNTGQGGVSQPSVVRVSTSVDGMQWSEPVVFARGDDTLAEIPPGQRGDVVLALDGQPARFVRLTFVRTGWLLIDELEVE